MNILTHPVHTGYQFDLAGTGHEFYSLAFPGSQEIFWDERFRPRPKNYHLLRTLNETPVKFDLALAHFDQGYHILKNVDVPMIFKEHCLRAPFHVPADWLERISYYSFASHTAANRWIVPKEFSERKTIIGMGIELETIANRKKRQGILTVGQNIRARGDEKGYGNLMRLIETFPITTVGLGSERIPGGVGPAPNYDVLKTYYQSHEVFLNPSNLLGLSTLEAMGAGLPVATFRMINSDIIRDGYNGFVVDTVVEAKRALQKLLHDKPLARKLGKNARFIIKTRFPMKAFVQRWNALFCLTLNSHVQESQPKSWQPFDMALKPEAERALANALISSTFEYHRIGHDRRTMIFLPNGWIGKGAGGCEVFWDVKVEGKSSFLDISSGGSLTCRLKRKMDGSWTGQWIHHEKMPIVLTPVSGNAK